MIDFFYPPFYRDGQPFFGTGPPKNWEGRLNFYNLPVQWNFKISIEDPNRLDKPETGLKILPVPNGRDFLVFEDNNIVKVWQDTFSLSLDFPIRKSKSRLDAWDEWQTPLRFTFFFALLEYDFLLLHASSLIRHDYALVFPGISGAGKTSIVRSAQNVPILSDEISAVRVGPKGTQDIAYGTPFHGDLGVPGDCLFAPLKGLFFPVKSRENHLTPLTPQETLRHLLPCIFSFTSMESRKRKLFDLGVALAEKVPGYLFYFNLTPGMWDMLDEL